MVGEGADCPYITVQFGLTREDPKCKYSMESTVPYFPDAGDDEIGEIGVQFVNFLRQTGFYMPNDYLLMESLTDEEYDVVVCALDTFRRGVSERSEEKNIHGAVVVPCSNKEE